MLAGNGLTSVDATHASMEDTPLMNSLASPPPTLGAFVEFVETGNSKDHDPDKGPESSEARTARRKLVSATMICFVFMGIEVVGGYLAGSLAIMTDAAHLASDICGFLVSLFALYLAERKATMTLSYGFKRAEIIGAILSVMIIWFLTGVLLWEAVRRVQGIMDESRGEVVDGKIMFTVAAFGLIANMTLLFVLGHDHGHGGGHGHSHGGGHGHSHGGGDSDHGHGHGKKSARVEDDGGHGHSHGDKKKHGHGHLDNTSHGTEDKAAAPPRVQENINISAAYIHALGDLIQSVGVCIAGALIWAFPGDDPRYLHVQLADPIATFLFSLLVLYSTYDIMKTSLLVLMEGVPTGTNPMQIAIKLSQIPGVVDVHHLHIWAISVGEPSLSVHLMISPKEGDHDATLRRAQHILREYGITHTTIQIESHTRHVCEPSDCEGAPCESYALPCDDSGKCFDHNTSSVPSKGNGNGYGSF